MSAFEAVIWDLGGVLARSFDRSGRARWEARLGLDEYGLERTVFGGEMGQKAALGQANSEQVWTWVYDQFDLDETAGRELKRDFWHGDGVDEELVAYIRGLKTSYKSGLITNAWLEIREQIEDQWRIDDAFDEMVISAEVGLVKPDPRIYQMMLKQLSVSPQASVFVDDFKENIAAAVELGMHGIQFHSREQAIDDLDRLLASEAGLLDHS